MTQYFILFYFTVALQYFILFYFTVASVHLNSFFISAWDDADKDNGKDNNRYIYGALSSTKPYMKHVT